VLFASLGKATPAPTAEDEEEPQPDPVPQHKTRQLEPELA
jgi:hypothetical protein